MPEKIIHIDLTSRSYISEDYSYEANRLYGRGLALDLLRKTVPDGADRYSPENAIVIVPGLFAGNLAPSACRMLVGTIEAADKGAQFCNTTGNMPQRLGSLGIAAIVITGIAAERGTVVHIYNDGIDFITDKRLNGRRTGDVIRQLKKWYCQDSAIIGCSIAGDMQLSLSSFFCTYPDGTPEYHSPRSGFGDVFGAKNLRALVVDGTEYFGRECLDPDRFKVLGKKLAAILTSDEICGGALPAYGSITLMKMLKSRTSLSELTKKDSAHVSEPIVSDGIKLNKTCAPMCVIGCLNRHINNEGKMLSSPSQVETQASIKKCFGVDNYQLASDVQRLATEIGINATEFITACKVYSESCSIENGEEHLMEWLDEIERGTLIGRVIASRTQGIYNLYRDKPISEWIDRRAIDDEELFDVRMNTSYPRLSGLSAMALLYAQIFVLENLGLCIFTSFALLDKTETFEILAEMFEARTGTKMTGEILVTQANSCLIAERNFNEHRWKSVQKSNIPPFTKVLYRYYSDRNKTKDE